MFMSLKDALLYPIRGNNIWKFLMFVLMQVVLSFIGGSATYTPIISILVGIFTAAYFWSCLQDLEHGYQDLPSLGAAFANWRHGIEIQIMQIVYGIWVFLIIMFLQAFVAPPLRYIAYLPLVLVLYFAYAVAIVRYVHEERTVVLFVFTEHIRTVIQNWRSCLALLGSLIMVIIFTIGLVAILTVGTAIIVQPSVLSETSSTNEMPIGISVQPSALMNSPIPQGIIMALGIALIAVFFYACLVNTYLFYSFGVSLGYFSQGISSGDGKKHKLKPLKEIYESNIGERQRAY
jgi:hypothetical protein